MWPKGTSPVDGLEEPANENVDKGVVATADTSVAVGFAYAVVEAPKENFARGDVTACEAAPKDKLGPRDVP